MKKLAAILALCASSAFALIATTDGTPDSAIPAAATSDGTFAANSGATSTDGGGFVDGKGSTTDGVPPPAPDSAPAVTIPTDGLITWLKFDDTLVDESGKVVDSSPVGTNTFTPATGQNEPTWASDGGGSAYGDGNDWITQDNLVLNLATSYTYSARLKFDNTLTVVEYPAWENNQQYGLYHLQGTNVRAYHAASAIRAVGVVSTNQFVHFLYTWSGGSVNEGFYYVDGVFIDSKSVGSGNVSQTQPWYLLNRTGQAANGWPGYIDEFCFWNRRLTSNEVQDVWTYIQTLPSE